MVELIDHIGIVVASVDASLATYTQALGLSVQEIESNEAFGVKIAFLPVGDTLVELIEPLTKEGTMASDFLQKHGEGLHHIAFRVVDIEAALAEMKKMGVPLLHETPQPGGMGARVAFLNPSATNNVFVELIERSGE